MIAPVILECDAEFIDEKEARHPVHIRLRSEASNRCSLIGSTYGTSGIAPHLFGALEGVVDEKRTLRSDTAFVSNVMPAEKKQSRHVDFLVDDLSLVTSSLKDMVAAKVSLQASTDLCSTWVLSGSRFISELLKEPLEFEIGGVKIDFRLERDAHINLAVQSGHAVEETTLLPVLRFRRSSGGSEFGACVEQMHSWQDEVDYISSCLAFYSQATVAWLDRTRALIHDGNSPAQELSRELRFRRVSLGPPHRRIDVAAGDVRAQLGSTTEIAKSWGTHFRSAIDFYVSSFVLADESRFISLSTSAEALKEAYQVATNRRRLFNTGEFKKLKAAVEKPIEEVLASINKAELAPKLIGEKIQEMNRPSYKDVIDELCKLLEVTRDDLYPGEFTFVKMRNDMVHQGRVPNRKELARESQKLTALLERLIAAALKRKPIA